MELAARVATAAIVVNGTSSEYMRARLRTLFPTEASAAAFDDLFNHVERRKNIPFVSGIPLDLFHDALMAPRNIWSAALCELARHSYVASLRDIMRAACTYVTVKDPARLADLCGPGFQLVQNPQDRAWRLHVMLFCKKWRNTAVLRFFDSFQLETSVMIPELKALIRRTIANLRTTKGSKDALAMERHLAVIARLLNMSLPAQRRLKGPYDVDRLTQYLGELGALTRDRSVLLAWAIASRIKDNLPTGADELLALKLSVGAIKKTRNPAYPRLPDELWSTIWHEFLTEPL